MDEEIVIKLGGLSLTMSHADAASVAAQLARAGVVAAGDVPGAVMIISDDHPMWQLHSGGERHEGPDWRPGDESLAATQSQLPRVTAMFHKALVDHPGQLMSVEDLAAGTGGALSSARVISGALAGYVNWCEKLDRRFPFYWWEGRNRESTKYAMQPRVAALFRGQLHT
jgi:Family of unknown function (DUF6416)